jgi:DNA-binding NarL/FixJ family response regulator
MSQIRVAFLDDHPVARAGLEAILESQPDLVAVGAAGDDHELWPLLYRTQPDVVVLDYHHPGRDGLSLGMRIKGILPAPRVVLYTASADHLAVPARLAGIDGLVDKGSAAHDLLRVIRAVHRGERELPPVSLRRQRESAAKLDPEDHAIFAMRLAGTSPREIAETLGLSANELKRRATAIFRILTSARPPAAAKLVPVS